MERYAIEPRNSEWAIVHNGIEEGSYATREGAFEAVYAAASNAIKKGAEIAITIKPPRPGEAAIGGPAS